jgi:hypothetical protein
MSPQQLIAQLWGSGIALGLSPDGQGLTVPAGKLTDPDRALILANKQSLVRLLTEAQATTTELLKAAMRVCDKHGDGKSAREAMRRECMELPTDMQRDLLEHFQCKPAVGLIQQERNRA